MFQELNTHIGTLKIRGVHQKEPALCRRLSYLFDTVNFRPPGIPPAGILIVRHMTDPLPGKLTNPDSSIRANIAWEQAAQNVLIEKYRKAARPVRGYIPTDAEAVFFADEAQMLAALALDMSRGEAWNRWWWKLVLRNLKPSPDMKTLLCREITMLPAVLHCLAEWGAAQKVIDTLSKDQALYVLETLSREYRLDEVLAPIFHPKEITANEAAKSDVKPPWEQWLPPHWLPAQMSEERATLLGIGLSLRYGPAKLRTYSFMRELRDWWEYRQLVKNPSRPGPAPDIPGTSANQPSCPDTDTGKQEAAGKRDEPPPAQRGKPAPGKRTENSRIFPLRSHDLPHSLPSHQDPGRSQKYSSEEKGKIGAKIRFDSDPGKPMHTGPLSADMLPKPLEKKETGKTGPGKPITVHVKKAAKILAEQGVDTQLGGVFYLINLMKHLDLPACFEEQCHLASQVGAWGVLELLARALLGEINQSLESDPLWQVLAEPDGREPGTLPGENFYCDKDIHLPEKWIKKLQITNHKLQTMHLSKKKAGAKSQITNYKQEKPAPLLKGLNPHLAPWLSLVLPYTRFRIHQALGPYNGERPDLVKVLLLYNARLYVTSTHVDIVIKLEDISLPVRMAGLDRDPGWVPEFARIILFHFE